MLTNDQRIILGKVLYKFLNDVPWTDAQDKIKERYINAAVHIGFNYARMVEANGNRWNTEAPEDTP